MSEGRQLTLQDVDQACAVALSQLTAPYTHAREERGEVVIYVVERSGTELGRWIIQRTRRRTGGVGKTPGVWWCCLAADAERLRTGSSFAED